MSSSSPSYATKLQADREQIRVIPAMTFGTNHLLGPVLNHKRGLAGLTPPTVGAFCISLTRWEAVQHPERF